MRQIQLRAAAGSRERLQELMAERDLDWLLLTGPETVSYATGFAESVETGPSPFSGGPTLALLSRAGDCGLVAPTRIPDELGVHVESYVGFHWAEFVDIDHEYKSAVSRLAKFMQVGNRIGYEARSCPASVMQMLHGEWQPIDRSLGRVRAIKSPAERELLTKAAQTAAHGQEIALSCSRVDVSELEAFAAIRCGMESFAGERIAVAGDYITGVERTSNAAGWPSTRRIQTGDPVICDLAPRVAGYWGDSCGSFAVGEASAPYQKLFRASSEALAVALDIIRPGLRIADLDAKMRTIVGRHGFQFPHHSGHSIGTSVHEWPRIVPFEQAIVEKDMVLMMEPSAYDPSSGGVRLEYMLHVEADGCRILAPFEHRAEV